MLYFLLLFSLICNFNASEVAIALQKFISTFWGGHIQGVKVSKCHGVKVHHQICRFELLKYIYILNIIYRRIFAPDI